MELFPGPTALFERLYIISQMIQNFLVISHVCLVLSTLGMFHWNKQVYPILLLLLDLLSKPVSAGKTFFGP